MSKTQMNFMIAVGAVVVGAVVIATAEQAFGQTSYVGKILRGTWVRRL